MVRKKQGTVQNQSPAELLITTNEAKSRLEERVEKGNGLRKIAFTHIDELKQAKKEYDKWTEYNNELLKRIFTTDEFATEYSYWGGGVIMMGGMSLSERVSEYYGDVDSKVRRLESIIERLELIPLAASVNVSNKADVAKDDVVSTNRVFIVHGHDEVSKNELELFLREIGLDPIVLHRQADQGRTIIEKFEQSSDVGYAFILLTPDEVAYLHTDEAKPDAERKKERRPRPNVIFEFGYFVGKLGRSKVCCLYSGDVSLPSDVGGVIYKKFAQKINEVAYDITKELKACGYRLL